MEGKSAKYPNREGGERAPTYRKSGSRSRHHKSTTPSRCSPVQSLSLIKPAATGRLARSTRSLPRRCRRAGSSLLPAPSADGALFFPLSVTAGGNRCYPRRCCPLGQLPLFRFRCPMFGSKQGDRPGHTKAVRRLDREVVSVDSRLLITRFFDPDAAKPYGYMVYVRCT